MAKHWQVLGYLRPNGGYVQVGETFEAITFEPQCKPFTKAEYEAGFSEYDAWKAEQDANAEAAVATAQAKLAALGLTADDLKALGL